MKKLNIRRNGAASPHEPEVSYGNSRELFFATFVVGQPRGFCASRPRVRGREARKGISVLEPVCRDAVLSDGRRQLAQGNLRRARNSNGQTRPSWPERSARALHARL